MQTSSSLRALRPTSFQELLSKARAGDSEALEALFEDFYPDVRVMVHRHLARDLRQNRPWLATRFSTGDIVQEVFRSVLSDLRAFGGTTEFAFVGYLTTVVRNRIVDAVRFHEAARRDGRRGAELSTGSSGAATGSHDPAKVVASVEQIERMHRALKSVSERERLLLRARLEGLSSFKELAEQLGYGSESAARRAFYAAKARLSILLERM